MKAFREDKLNWSRIFLVLAFNIIDEPNLTKSYLITLLDSFKQDVIKELNCFVTSRRPIYSVSAVFSDKMDEISNMIGVF